MNVQNWPAFEGLGRHPALETLAGRAAGRRGDRRLPTGQEFPLAEPGTLTFAWRGEADHVDSVRWIHGGGDRRPFARLAGTDLWLLGCRSRTAGGSSTSSAIGRHGQEELIVDPLNPARAGDPSGRTRWRGRSATSGRSGACRAARRRGGSRRSRWRAGRSARRATVAGLPAGRARSGARLPAGGDPRRRRLRHLCRPAGGARQPDRRRRDPAGDRGAGADPRPARANIPAGGSTRASWSRDLLPALAARWRIAEAPGTGCCSGRASGRWRRWSTAFRYPGVLRRAGAEVGLVHPRRAQAGAPAAPGLPPHRAADAGAAPRAAAAGHAGLRLDRRARGAGGGEPGACKLLARTRRRCFVQERVGRPPLAQLARPAPRRAAVGAATRRTSDQTG